MLRRRQQVERYVLRRLSARQIAQLLGVSVRTIYSDLSALERGRGELVKHAQEVKEALGELLATSRERQRVLWQQHANENNGAVKMGIVRELRMEDAQILSALQSLGALPKEPDELKVREEPTWQEQLRALRRTEEEEREAAEADDRSRRHLEAMEERKARFAVRDSTNRLSPN